MTIEVIQNIIEAKSQIFNASIDIKALSIDTRRIVHPEHTLFFALTGERRSGNHFIQDAYQKGVRNFVVGEGCAYEFDAEVNVFIVKDPLQALQHIGSYVRAQYQYPVIAVTGSNGKTIVKEWIARVLSQVSPYQENGGVVKSPKSYNSQIGVPLSVWQMDATHTIGVFEAGISKVGEMEKLADILQPTIGVFTNIGDAHSEYFISKKEKIAEKFKLFKGVDTLIINEDDALTKEAVAALRINNPSVEIFNWSYVDAGARLFITHKKIGAQLCQIQYIYQQEEQSIIIPFTQEAYIQNAMNVVCALLHLGVAHKIIREHVLYLKAVAMRLELRDAINNSYIIADTYNSDLSSLKVALEFLAQQVGKKRTVVLSDMKESGKSMQVLIKEIVKLFTLYKVEKAIIIGEYNEWWKREFENIVNIETYFYDTTDQFLGTYSPSFFNNEYILLKGARVFEFERIQTRLELKIHHTVLEVDLEALAYNLKVYKSYIDGDTKLMAMVKAHSYGSGSLEIAQRLQYEGVDYLAVAYVDEGIELRNGGISLPIMVMSPEIHSFESMIRWRLEPEIFNMNSLKLFIEVAEKYQEVMYPIHIKLDTGMHRLGFEAGDIEELINIVKRSESIRIASVFSHFAGSDAAYFDDFTKYQYGVFEQLSQQIIAAVSYPVLRHINNSAAIVNHPGLQCNMVRLGIGLYGIDASDKIQQQLKNVSTLKSYIVQLRHVKAADTVGYSRKGVLTRDSVIATVAIGYADGYIRAFGNGNGYMLVHGKPAPLIGNVCMDMCMLDVTDVPNVQEGDEVIVFGSDLSVVQLASWANTIPYEILTNISRRVKRIYVGN